MTICQICCRDVSALAWRWQYSFLLYHMWIYRYENNPFPIIRSCESIILWWMTRRFLRLVERVTERNYTIFLDHFKHTLVSDGAIPQVPLLWNSRTPALPPRVSKLYVRVTNSVPHLYWLILSQTYQQQIPQVSVNTSDLCTHLYTHLPSKSE